MAKQTPAATPNADVFDLAQASGRVQIIRPARPPSVTDECFKEHGPAAEELGTSGALVVPAKAKVTVGKTQGPDLFGDEH